LVVESIRCPNCGAALPEGSAGTLTCGFCNSTVRQGTDPSEPHARDSDAGLRALIEQKNTIEAIRLYRDSRSCTLKEARDGVAAMAREMGMTLGSGSGSMLSCPVLAFAGLAWAPLMVLIPLLVRRALEAGRPFPAGKAALVQAGGTIVLLALTCWWILIAARRTTRLRGFRRSNREGGPS
jgi:hypothetical protein